MSSETPFLSFATDIRPLFRQKDIDAMKAFGDFDLASYDDVRGRATKILEELESGSMPCDDRWPEHQVDKFRRWMNEGMRA